MTHRVSVWAWWPDLGLWLPVGVGPCAWPVGDGIGWVGLDGGAQMGRYWFSPP